jgi:hypothetical protein
MHFQEIFEIVTGLLFTWCLLSMTIMQVLERMTKISTKRGLFMIGLMTPVESSPGFDILRKIVIDNAAGIKSAYPV